MSARVALELVAHCTAKAGRKAHTAASTPAHRVQLAKIF
jgi:hypothetical protein